MARKPTKKPDELADAIDRMDHPRDANEPEFKPEVSQATKIAEDINKAVVNRAENQVSGFRQFADAYQGTAIVGQLLRFNKGDWVAGRDETSIDIGTLMMVQMKSMLWGYQKWSEKKPVAAKWARLAEDEQPIRRQDLGDHDESQWEEDDQGDLRDPWQETMMVLLMDEEGEIYTFVTSSKGGLGALAKLANVYDRRRRMKPHDMPIVELNADSYKHPVYKKIFTPKFDIVKWTHEDNFADITDDMVNSGIDEEVDVGSEEGFGPKARGKQEVIPPEKGNGERKTGFARVKERAAGDL